MPFGVENVSKTVGERVVPPNAHALLLSCLVHLLWITLLRIEICVSIWCTLSLPLLHFSFVSIKHMLRTSQIFSGRDLELLWCLLGCRDGMSLWVHICRHIQWAHSSHRTTEILVASTPL